MITTTRKDIRSLPSAGTRPLLFSWPNKRRYVGPSTVSDKWRSSGVQQSPRRSRSAQELERSGHWLSASGVDRGNWNGRAGCGGDLTYYSFDLHCDFERVRVLGN